MAGCAVTSIAVGFTAGTGAVAGGASPPVGGAFVDPAQASVVISNTTVATTTGKKGREEKRGLFTRQATAEAGTMPGLGVAALRVGSAGHASRAAQEGIPRPIMISK